MKNEHIGFPERLRLRDTRLHDDMGGAGQRIYTTAGQGYQKQEYVRGDIVDLMQQRIEELKSKISNHNAAMVVECEWSQEQKRCEGYIVRQMTCPDCPKEHMIE